MITVVSGLPRSGTSLLMQMLEAGGLPALTDGIRAPDEDNPRGYFEWERIRTLPRDPACIGEAENKAVKVISTLLRFLPPDRPYKVVFATRNLEEVAASQGAMISRRKTSAPAAEIAAALKMHLNEIKAWLPGQPNMEVLWVNHANLLAEPRRQAQLIADFVGILDAGAMEKQVVPSLHRQHK